MIGYKVVRELLGVMGPSEFVSARSGAMVYYAKDKWTYPDMNCGPLCLFDTFDAAMDFVMKICEPYELMSVWTCDYLPSERTYVFNDNSTYPLTQLPIGTILAESIKLEERLI